MIRAIEAEWIKIRTILSHKILVLGAIAFPIIIGVLAATFGDVDEGPNSTEMAEFVTSMMVVSTMLLGVVAVIGLTSEYTHNTLRPTYAATPRRARVLASKLIVSTAVTLTTAVAVALGCFFITTAIFNSRGGEVSFGDDNVVTILVSGLALSLIVTWFGFGLGLIIRNSPATVSILLLWPLLIESLLLVVINLVNVDSLNKFLPYQAAIAAGVADPGDSTFGRPGAHLYFAAVALGLVAIGVLLDERRDA